MQRQERRMENKPRMSPAPGAVSGGNVSPHAPLRPHGRTQRTCPSETCSPSPPVRDAQARLSNLTQTSHSPSPCCPPRSEPPGRVRAPALWPSDPGPCPLHRQPLLGGGNLLLCSESHVELRGSRGAMGGQGSLFTTLSP